MHDLKDSQTGIYVGRNDRSMRTARPQRRAPKPAATQKTSAKRAFTPTRKKVSK